MMIEHPTPVTLLAIVATGCERPTSLLAPYLGGSCGYAIVFDATLTEAPNLPGFEVEFFDAFLANTSTGRDRELVCYSLPGLFSLRQSSTSLREIFPGLREVTRRHVSLLPFTTLIDRIGDKADPISLIIDLPGEEFDLLLHLENLGLLERIEKIKLRCGSGNFFEGSKTAGELQTWLSKQGFVVAQRDESDSAWPILEFAANQERRRITFLERDLAEREVSAASAKVEVVEIAKRLQALEVQLEASHRDLSDRDAALKKAEAATAEMNKRQQALVNDVRRLRLSLRDREEDALRRRREFDRMRSDHGMLLSILQARAEELTALREDYRKLSGEKQALQGLLAKLTPRLREAASQLQSLVFLPGQSNPNVQAVHRQEKDSHYRKRKGQSQ